MSVLQNYFKKKTSEQLFNIAIVLAIITISYNILEGIISVLFATHDETLALFGFGVDSFVEVLSGIGILHMVTRIKKNIHSDRDRFEGLALLITGLSFILLSAGLVAGSALNLWYQHKPLTTFAGVVISGISLLTMLILYAVKMETGRALDSKAIIADARCTLTCFYLSGVLLFSSMLYEIFKLGYFDVVGSLGIAVFAFKEGRESINGFIHKKSGGKCAD